MSIFRWKKKNLKSILIVEDNEMNMEVMRDYLLAKEFLIDTAEKAVDGIAMMKKKKFDAVIMDVQLPELDGMEAIRIIRSDPKISDTPILAVTALAMLGDRDKCLEAGANEYMSKPVKLSELLIIMKKLTGLTT